MRVPILAHTIGLEIVRVDLVVLVNVLIVILAQSPQTEVIVGLAHAYTCESVVCSLIDTANHRHLVTLLLYVVLIDA